ncbi:uncharacterized protein F4822DRAFT_42997 [Hypoxylon trugodes]|uniref:uncharacterized protein n=1 Tax=Hypoxylon trugodes TaxID=326681 RepID=UPI00219E2A0C|nr:uncharacterized protein F4822DRAFT_42997 [Hypoxylon trugodes]KAI1394256.1 hypothetical protein F4822DRAFT_42997 [Hypoxylon trugodes]
MASNSCLDPRTPSNMSDCGSKSTSSPPTDYTPTHTTDSHSPASNKPFTIDGGGIGTAPEADRIYIIRDLDTGKALTLEGGHLTLKGADTNGGWRWECVERGGGWLGFRELVSHNYLGRNGFGGFWAVVPWCAGWENFALRPLEVGGYHLMSPNWWSFRRVSVSSTGKLVEVLSAPEAIRWEFIEVGR